MEMTVLTKTGAEEAIRLAIISVIGLAMLEPGLMVSAGMAFLRVLKVSICLRIRSWRTNGSIVPRGSSTTIAPISLWPVTPAWSAAWRDTGTMARIERFSTCSCRYSLMTPEGAEELLEPDQGGDAWYEEQLLSLIHI